MSDTKRTAKEWFSIQNGRTYAGDADYVAAIKEIQEDAIAAIRAEYPGTPEQSRAAMTLAKATDRSGERCLCDTVWEAPCLSCLARLALGLSNEKDATK